MRCKFALATSKPMTPPFAEVISIIFQVWRQIRLFQHLDDGFVLVMVDEPSGESVDTLTRLS